MFVTDRQTLCDLQIFGESADAGSVYALFASGLTPGGRAKLEQMLLVPLDDCIALRKRRDTVRYFMEQDCALPVKLDAMYCQILRQQQLKEDQECINYGLKLSLIPNLSPQQLHALNQLFIYRHDYH